MKRVARLLLATSFLTACAGTTAPGNVAGTYWRLTRVGDTPAIQGSTDREAHLKLVAEAMRVTGSTGCNSMSGTYSLTGERITFGPLITTKMACVEDERNRQEQEFVRALATADRFTATPDSLILFTGSSVTARFAAVPGR